MKMNEMVLDRVTGGANNGETAGLKCPRCGEFIPTTIEQIIIGTPIICSHCLLRINISPTRSKSAIDALRKVQEAMDALERKQQAE